MVVYNLRLFIIDSNNTIIEEHEIINALKYELTHVGWSKYENMTDIQKKLMGDMYYITNIIDNCDSILYTITKDCIHTFIKKHMENIYPDYSVQFYIFSHLNI